MGHARIVMKNYFDLLPIDRVVAFKGRQFIVRAVWNEGVVFRSVWDGTMSLINGSEKLKEVTL